MSRDAAGRITFSIDLEPSLDLPEELTAEFDAVSRRLLSLFDRHKLAATWAVADPGRSIARDDIRRSPQGHEIAVLGERSWLSDQVGRNLQARELNRRLQGARNAGLSVSTLVLRDVELADHTWMRDLGVRTVRTTPVDDLAEGVASGVWRLPARAGWLERWFLRRRVARQLSRVELLHIALEASHYAEAGAGTGLLFLDEVLELVTAAARKGKLRVITLGKNTDELAPVLGPTRSALRPAA